MAMSIFNSWAVNGPNGPNLLGPQSANVIFSAMVKPFQVFTFIWNHWSVSNKGGTFLKKLLYQCENVQGNLV